jgi:hypothetical protein
LCITYKYLLYNLYLNVTATKNCHSLLTISTTNNNIVTGVQIKYSLYLIIDNCPQINYNTYLWLKLKNITQKISYTSIQFGQNAQHERIIRKNSIGC